MNELFKNIKVVVASDVSCGRDGIGVEIYYEGELLVEIFRDDTKKSRVVTLPSNRGSRNFKAFGC